MYYIAKYLPVDKPFTDGCTVINQAGEHFTYNEAEAWNKATLRVAEMYLIAVEFNVEHAVGRPSAVAQTWLKPGMHIKTINCHQEKDTLTPTFRVKCPCCGDLH